MIEHRAAHRLRPAVVGEVRLNAARIDRGNRLTDGKHAHCGKLGVIGCLHKGRLDDISARIGGNGGREVFVGIRFAVRLGFCIGVDGRDLIGMPRQTASPDDRRRMGLFAVRPAFDGNGEGKLIFARLHDLELDLSGTALVIRRLGDGHREGVFAHLGGDRTARPAARRIGCRLFAAARVGALVKLINLPGGGAEHPAVHPAAHAFDLLLKGDLDRDGGLFDREERFGNSLVVVIALRILRPDDITARVRGNGIREVAVNAASEHFGVGVCHREVFGMLPTDTRRIRRCVICVIRPAIDIDGERIVRPRDKVGLRARIQRVVALPERHRDGIAARLGGNSVTAVRRARVGRARIDDLDQTFNVPVVFAVDEALELVPRQRHPGVLALIDAARDRRPGERELLRRDSERARLQCHFIILKILVTLSQRDGVRLRIDGRSFLNDEVKFLRQFFVQRRIQRRIIRMAAVDIVPCLKLKPLAGIFARLIEDDDAYRSLRHRDGIRYSEVILELVVATRRHLRLEGVRTRVEEPALRLGRGGELRPSAIHIDEIDEDVSALIGAVVGERRVFIPIDRIDDIRRDDNGDRCLAGHARRELAVIADDRERRRELRAVGHIRCAFREGDFQILGQIGRHRLLLFAVVDKLGRKFDIVDLCLRDRLLPDGDLHIRPADAVFAVLIRERKYLHPIGARARRRQVVHKEIVFERIGSIRRDARFIPRKAVIIVGIRIPLDDGIDIDDHVIACGRIIFRLRDIHLEFFAISAAHLGDDGAVGTAEPEGDVVRRRIHAEADLDILAVLARNIGRIFGPCVIQRIFKSDPNIIRRPAVCRKGDFKFAVRIDRRRIHPGARSIVLELHQRRVIALRLVLARAVLFGNDIGMHPLQGQRAFFDGELFRLIGLNNIVADFAIGNDILFTLFHAHRVGACVDGEAARKLAARGCRVGHLEGDILAIDALRLCGELPCAAVIDGVLAALMRNNGKVDRNFKRIHGIEPGVPRAVFGFEGDIVIAAPCVLARRHRRPDDGIFAYVEEPIERCIIKRQRKDVRKLRNAAHDLPAFPHKIPIENGIIRRSVFARDVSGKRARRAVSRCNVSDLDRDLALRDLQRACCHGVVGDGILVIFQNALLIRAEGGFDGVVTDDIARRIFRSVEREQFLDGGFFIRKCPRKLHIVDIRSIFAVFDGLAVDCDRKRLLFDRQRARSDRVKRIILMFRDRRRDGICANVRRRRDRSLTLRITQRDLNGIVVKQPTDFISELIGLCAFACGICSVKVTVSKRRAADGNGDRRFVHLIRLRDGAVLTCDIKLIVLITQHRREGVLRPRVFEFGLTGRNGNAQGGQYIVLLAVMVSVITCGNLPLLIGAVVGEGTLRPRHADFALLNDEGSTQPVISLIVARNLPCCNIKLIIACIGGHLLTTQIDILAVFAHDLIGDFEGDVGICLSINADFPSGAVIGERGTRRVSFPQVCKSISDRKRLRIYEITPGVPRAVFGFEGDIVIAAPCVLARRHRRPDDCIFAHVEEPIERCIIKRQRKDVRILLHAVAARKVARNDGF